MSSMLKGSVVETALLQSKPHKSMTWKIAVETRTTNNILKVQLAPIKASRTLSHIINLIFPTSKN